jgi:5'-methylthioadenosine phosphorylase
MIGIIGGTGLYDPDFLREQETLRIETAHGDCQVTLGKIGKVSAVFLARHGASHDIPPHKVEYKKNVSAMKIAGADRIISINSVGSLDISILPGSVLVPHDFIDFTNGRETTFYDDKVVHVDMTEPYCREIRGILNKCSKKFFSQVLERGVYVCTEGPRFETPSEIRMLRLMGGNVVGMVGFPEVVLAREAGLCYASICLVANLGSGISREPMSIEDVKRSVLRNMGSVKKTLKCVVQAIPETRGCRCSDYILEAGV